MDLDDAKHARHNDRSMNEETVIKTIQPLAATAAGYLPHLETLCLKIFVMCVQWERER